MPTQMLKQMPTKCQGNANLNNKVNANKNAKGKAHTNANAATTLTPVQSEY